MSFLSEGMAVVTGAGSGIGRALAQQLAAAGSALALADVDEAGLLQTAQSLETTRALLTTHGGDVSHQAAGRAFPGGVQIQPWPRTPPLHYSGNAPPGRFVKRF